MSKLATTRSRKIECWGNVEKIYSGDYSRNPKMENVMKLFSRYQRIEESKSDLSVQELKLDRIEHELMESFRGLHHL